jgi:hypothetical protein
MKQVESAETLEEWNKLNETKRMECVATDNVDETV